MNDYLCRIRVRAGHGETAEEAMSKPRVEIEYCTRCGFLLRAAWIAQELLSGFPEELGEVALRPGAGGNFIVRLEGQVLYSRREQGRFPESKELKQCLAERIAPQRRFGHSKKKDGTVET